MLKGVSEAARDVVRARQQMEVQQARLRETREAYNKAERQLELSVLAQQRAIASRRK